ncbi:hypothetical protein A464_795 [Salmonella bongori N268-08]|uniref:Uncharacterized protein n=1 Tax=Salmonella bongori N268-08 TaxID=1197719 RepID=S5MMW7_SALBN|nr:hypothetical protein A464_795 [Salmonella bongori N268-08]
MHNHAEYHRIILGYYRIITASYFSHFYIKMRIITRPTTHFHNHLININN